MRGAHAPWLFVLVAACSSASDGDVAASAVAAAPPRDGARDSAVAEGLERFRAIVGTPKGTALGLSSAAELDGATLGRPIAVHRIARDRLAEHPRDTETRALLAGLAGEEAPVLYPVVLGGHARALLAVAKQPDGAWRVVGFGWKGRAAEIEAAGHVLEARGVTDYSLVEVPGLALRMLASEKNGALVLTPLKDVEGTRLRRGEPVEARDALEQIAREARRRPVSLSPPSHSPTRSPAP